MADLNDDIKKYLNGELTPAEMHALEKRALNDPFLEDALEGATQLGPNAFQSDLSNLRSSLEERISKKPGKVISLWTWTARIAAGLAFVALSTFVIIQLTNNENEEDLALQRDSSNTFSEKSSESASDSSSFSNDEATAEEAKPELSAPAGKDAEPLKDIPDPEESKPTVAQGPPATETADDNSAAEKERIDNQLAKSTEALRADSTIVAHGEPEQLQAEKEIDARTAVRKQLDDSDKKRVAANQPATAPIQGYTSGVAASRVITGRVQSVDGIGLPGVNVMIKNSNIGTVTDASGLYHISVPGPNPSLVFSYIGFSSTEVAAEDNAQVDVQLNEDVSQLSEVVVVGYGSEKTDETMETLEMANPYGGRRAFKQYLEKNMQYPEQALANNIEGRVTIQFTVESSGLLRDFKVIKGIGHGCDEEVIRLVKQGPKWNPTRRNTESLRDKVKVRMRFTLPKK